MEEDLAGFAVPIMSFDDSTDTSTRLPWHGYLLRFAIVMLGVVVYQQVVRGMINLRIAVAVGVGYVLIAALVRRR